MWTEWRLTVFVAIILLIFFKFWWSRRRIRHLANKIPGPPTLPFVGNLFDHLHGPEKIFSIIREHWKKVNGGNFRVWLGPMLHVVITIPEDVELLLNNTRVINRDEYVMNTLRPVFGNGLITCRANTWKKQRKLYAPLFQTKMLEKYVETFNKQTKLLLKKLEDFADGQSFDILSLVMMCSGDMICESTLGSPLGLQHGEDGKYTTNVVNRMENIFYERIARPWLYYDFLFNLTGMGKESKEGINILSGFSNMVLKKTFEEHREMKSSLETTPNHSWMGKGLTLPHSMIRSFESEGKPVDEVLLRDEVHTIALAGMDTTALSVSFVLIFLGLHLQWQEDIYQELREIFVDDEETDVTPEDIKKMKRLDRFIKETMRILPVVPIIPREVDEELKLSTCTLPAGCLAIVMNYFVHRDPRYFPDPERFDPDRFLPGRSQDRHPCSYIPFGAGPRMCVGFKYAEMAMAATIANIMMKYRLLPAVTYEDLQKLQLGIVFRPTCGFLVKMLPRKTESTPK